MHSKTRIKCAGCNNDEFLVEVLRFGEIPLAGYFPEIAEIWDSKAYNCNLLLCDRCGMLQVDTLVSPKILFKDYRYMSSIGLANHFTKVAEYLTNRFSLKEKDKVVLEFGSNDGVLLKPFNDLGVKTLGFEPSENISQIAKNKGCNIIVDFFNYKTAKENELENSADLICANNVFAHIDDLDGVAEGVKYCLKSKGSFVIEVHYLLNLVQQNQYDFIYHEHIFYHSLYSLNNFFRKHSMTIYDFELIDVHSGSVRIFIKNGLENINRKVERQIEIEINAGITDSKGFKNFLHIVSSHIVNCKKVISELAENKRTLIGFGASGRCSVFCNLLELGTEQIKFIFDQSPERINRFIPGANIPILDFTSKLAEKEYDVVVIFAWNFANMIMKKVKARDYLVLFPQPRFVKETEIIKGIL